MAKKQFKTESKRLLDLMVNSIYTHKEIFLRELISNASDAIDKLYFRSLTDQSVTLNREDYEIRLTPDKEARTLTVSDNGIGMTAAELEKNLGTIARSGSFDFKAADPEGKEAVDIIGQFGVGFYSAFMVSDRITVVSRAYGSDEANCWESSGADGYTVTPCEKETPGTVITLRLKADTEEIKYSDYLEEWELRSLVKKYSDYIRYPIRMQVSREQKKEGTEDEYETVTADETLNSMTPIWKKAQSEVTDEEYAAFYQEKFYDFEAPLKVIRQKAEGTSNYEALLFIPARAPFDYYSRDFEKGLQLYSSGVMIMEKCKDLLPDHYSFVRGLVDSADLSLNISREMLQHDRQLKIIAKALEKKITAELKKLQRDDRESYEKFYTAFGTQLKWGLYSDYGTHKDTLQDLVMFRSSNGDKPVTLAEYCGRMPESQTKILYAAGETVERIAMLPQVEAAVARGQEVLYLTEDVDEFALKMLRVYEEKEFADVCKEDADLGTEEEKEALSKANEAAADLLTAVKDALGDAVASVRLTDKLGDHPACLSTEGELSVGMEKTLNKMPGIGDEKVKATLVLELNKAHPVLEKLEALRTADPEKLAAYSKVLYANARLLSGLPIEDPAEYGKLVANLMAE